MWVNLHLLHDDNKIAQTFQIKKLDWCGIFKNGKVPNDFLWKVMMSGFGKYLKKYTKCPITTSLEFDRMNADPKMMLLAPTLKTRLDMWIEYHGENGKRDLMNLTFVGQVVDE